jgi:hypothetical protein
VVVDDFDVCGVVASPHKADTPLLVDTNAVLSGPIATQFLQPIGGGDLEISQRCGPVQHPEFPQGGALDVCWQIPRWDSAKQALSFAIAEGDKHEPNL